MREQNASFTLPDGGSIYTLLGELALVREAWTEAEAAFAKSRESLSQSWHQLDLVFSLAGMARSALGQRRLSLARRHLVDALRDAISLKTLPGLVYTLPVTALYFAETGDSERSLALWRLAGEQPFVSKSAWFGDVIDRPLIVRLGKQLTHAEGEKDEQEADLWSAAAASLELLELATG